MNECANEDLEIQRMRQMLDQGFDDTDVAEGTLEIHERSYSVAELIDEIRSIATTDCLEDAEGFETSKLRDSEPSVGNDSMTMKICEKEEVLPLDLWSPQYIRRMTSFTYELCGFFCGHERIEAYRENDRQIKIKYESNIDYDAGVIADPMKVKTVVISEDEWNIVISYLFNHVQIDLWDNHISCYSRKVYMPDGSNYRHVPVCDGYGWNLTVCGDRRKHEFSGNCQVPDNWNDFSRLMDALKAKTNEPSLDLSLYLASENY